MISEKLYTDVYQAFNKLGITMSSSGRGRYRDCPAEGNVRPHKVHREDFFVSREQPGSVGSCNCTFHLLTSSRVCSLCNEKRHHYEAAQKGQPARPQARQEPEAYPLGYVEDSCETRTKLGAFFSSR